MLEPLYDTIHSKIITASVLGIDERQHFQLMEKQDWMDVGCKKQNRIILLHFRIQQRCQNLKETLKEILKYSGI